MFKFLRTILVISVIVYSVYFMYSSILNTTTNSSNAHTEFQQRGYSSREEANQNCLGGTVIEMYKASRIAGYGCLKE